MSKYLSFINGEVLLEAKKKYDLTDEEVFTMFVIPALDDAERLNKKFEFPYNPLLPIGNTNEYSQEWEYLRDKYGYRDTTYDGFVWILKK